MLCLDLKKYWETKANLEKEKKIRFMLFSL